MTVPPPIARSRRWMDGKKSGRFCPSTWARDDFSLMVRAAARSPSPRNRSVIIPTDCVGCAASSNGQRLSLAGLKKLIIDKENDDVHDDRQAGAVRRQRERERR